MDSDRSRLQPAVLLEAVLSSITVAGFIISTWGTRSVWVAWALAGATAAAQVWLYLQARKHRIYDFKNETDPKFVKFFREWYSQDGDHYVFCNDLDWLDATDVAQVRQTLGELGSRLKVYLVRDTGRACAEIRDAGGEIVIIPENLVTDLPPKMSLVRDNESHQIILRRKQPHVDRVRFIKTEDPHMLCLANTIVNACKN